MQPMTRKAVRDAIIGARKGRSSFFLCSSASVAKDIAHMTRRGLRRTRTRIPLVQIQVPRRIPGKPVPGLYW